MYCSDVLKVILDFKSHTYLLTLLFAFFQPRQGGDMTTRSSDGDPIKRLARYAYIYADVVSAEDLENLKNSINDSVGTVLLLY